MEATHLGVRLSGYDLEALDRALALLEVAPTYQDKLWLTTAFKVIREFPFIPYEKGQGESIGIPTWMYGHEPATPFASKIAKYFANSVREEGLLAIARGGVIYAPGSAGTIQEVFQDACQNHYKSYDFASPMIFLNEGYWKWTKPVYPLLGQLAAGNEYAALISCSDTVADIVDAIKKFTPPS
jgi:predicted Rossmann-fold nucleotide-binding protein